MRRLWPIVPAAGVCVAIGFAVSAPDETVIASFSTPLNGRTTSQRHNAELAANRLRSVTVLPGETFSFNKAVGTFSRDQGYRKAPVSYNGQLISSFGGGVCQVSTTLYNAALLAGMDIVERRRHRFAPGYVPPGRDAAVAYDTVDLKFRNPYDVPVRIEGRVDRDQVTFEIHGAVKLRPRPEIVQIVRQVRKPQVVELRGKGPMARVRNSGKAGCSVTVYRIIGDRREFISKDEYPAMNRIVEYR